MEEYFSSKYAIKRRVYALISFSYLFCVLLNSLIDHATTRFYDLSTIMRLIVVTACAFLIISLAKRIYEPALKISNGKIAIRIDEDYNFWETTWANLSHVEVKSERLDSIAGDRQYEYVYFKKPVVRNARFLGLNLWRMSKMGFRLDILDEKAGKEIKARLS